MLRAGRNKTKYFKMPRPEDVPKIPPPLPKLKAERKQFGQDQQTKEWKKVKKVYRRVLGF